MLRLGVVSEGVSDFLVLREVMRQIRPDIESVHLFPDETLSSLGRGWKGVQAWCGRYGSDLEAYMRAIPSRQLHLIVIQADCSMADKVGADRPCPPSSDTAEALARVIDNAWLKRVPRPPFVLVVTPAMTTDTWVVATLDPPSTELATIECDKAAEDELIKSSWGSIKRLRKRYGEIQKPRLAYLPFAERVGLNLALVTTRCPQARSFCESFGQATASVNP